MSYYLGVDLGTTYTAAAVYRDRHARIVELGTRSAAVPSVLFVKDDEEHLIGEAATRRGITEPSRLAREFKRRFGDPTPLILGGSPYAPDALMAKMLRWVIDAVEEREGGPPERVTVSHPANWGQYKSDLLDQSLRLAGLTEAETITEPEAAAVYYASNERVEPGTIVAVYDLGGGTFDAAVLRKTPEGFEIRGRPEGIEHLGGVDFDLAILAKVDQETGGSLSALDLTNPTHAQAAARLRDEVIGAKEALSTDTDTSIPVVLPDLQTEVRLTRDEFEEIVRRPLADTIAALRRALDSAGVSAAEVSKVLLVGGSSRIPLVAELVSAELGRPVAVDAHPKHAIPLGAALAAAGVDAAPGMATVEPPGEEAETMPVAAVAPTLADQKPVLPETTEREAAPVSPPRSRVPAVLAVIVLVLAALGGTAWALGLGPFAKDDDGATTSEVPADEETTPEEEDDGGGDDDGGEAPAPAPEPEPEAPEPTETPVETPTPEPTPTEVITPVETPT
jgi:molecular chaperone DnaK